LRLFRNKSNEEKFIGECVRSVLEQNTTRRYEVIVVDNNSADDTRKIASEFSVQLVVEKKPGDTAARNTGARLAKADILYFLDADCRLPLGQIDRICQVFVDNPMLDVVAGYCIYDRDGLLPYLVTGPLRYFYFWHKALEFVFGVSTFPGGNFAIRKVVFQKVRGFDEIICNQEIVLPDDLDLALRLHNADVREMLFDSKFRIYSSFRRMKRSPIRDTLVRFFATCKILFGRCGGGGGI
jgi:glycosyltransferase involved in cell wall biosynthesis